MGGRFTGRIALAVACAAALAAAVVALALNARHYYPFISDDSFISLRYAQRLLAGDGLTWTDGPPVEGYSNLLWTLACAALGGAGLDLVVASRALGLLGFAAALVAILWAVRLARMSEVAAALVGMLALAASGAAGAWAVGGLEQPMVAALLAWALAACPPLLAEEPPTRRQVGVPGLLLALVTLARADGAVLVAAVCAGVVVMHRLRWPGWRRGLLLAALPAAAFLGQLAFRVIYYDAWIPNTALVKVAFTLDRLRGGGAYVLAAARSSALVLLVAALPLVAGAHRRGPRWRHACLAWIVAAIWAAYVVFIGGDIFPAHRHFVPVLVALCMAAALGLCALAERWPRARWIAVGAGLAAVAVFAALQPADKENRRAVSERWEGNGEVVGRLLDSAFRDREPLMAAAAVGSLCYWAKLPALDMLGLNDRHIASHRPGDFGTGLIGHELGDGAYAMSRRPDLLVFCGPTGRSRPCSRGEKEMVADPQFGRAYQLVRFRGTVPRAVDAQIWVRRSGRIGIEASPDLVRVPGYLLTGRDVRAELDEEHRIGLRLPPRGSAQVTLPLPAGHWRARLESAAASGLAISVTSSSDHREISRAETGEVVFEVDDVSAQVSVRVESRSSGRPHMRAVVIERRP
ncbi:MAG TPA: hypothetical protein VKB80_05325 [Kofleriaceae bacterium]|nr:hypothetical protein [Kofleriaceae bacterium]